MVIISGLLSLTLTAAGQSWVQTTSLPDGYQEHGLAYAQGFLFHTGGVSANNAELSGTNVFYAQVFSNGTIGVWMTNTPVPEAVFDHASVAANGYLYVLGGYHYTTAASDYLSAAVYYAKVNTNGVLGSWQTANPLPYPVYFHSAAVWDNRIYVIGGLTDKGATNQVLSANIQPNGSLSEWIAQTPLPYGLAGHASVVANDVLYVISGAISNGTKLTNSVCLVNIAPDGTLGNWIQTTHIPQAVANFASVAANGFIFAVGGFNGSSAINGFVNAQVAGDGSLKSWTSGTPLPISVFYHAAAVSDSYIFVSGGNAPTITSPNVYSIALPAPPVVPTLVAHSFTNGNFQVQLASSTNTGFGLLASTNLTSWTNIGWGFTGTNGTLLFTDTNAARFPHRFYPAYWPLP